MACNWSSSLLAPDQSVVCLPAVPDTFEGPTGYLHGGIIATILDETMSKSIRARGLTAMTRHMEVDYLRPVPSASPVRLEGLRIVRSEGRKHWAEAKVLNAEAAVTWLMPRAYSSKSNLGSLYLFRSLQG